MLRFLHSSIRRIHVSLPVTSTATTITTTTNPSQLYTKSTPTSTRQQYLHQRSKYRKELKKTRKKYYTTTLNQRQQAIQFDQSPNALQEKENLALSKLSNPMLVGTYKSRRELKRDRLRLFGQYEPIPVNQTKPLPPSNKPPTNLPKLKFNTTRQLRRLFNRDLQPSNPRLIHLLYLWHSTQHFITPQNIEQKLNQFFDTKHMEPSLSPVTNALRMAGLTKSFSDHTVPLSSRIHQILEFGVTETDDNHNQYTINLNDKFDPRQFADIDKVTAPSLHASPTLSSGSVYEHAITRDIATRDKLTDSLLGRPNVAKILQWGITVTDPLATAKSKPKFPNEPNKK